MKDPWEGGGYFISFWSSKQMELGSRVHYPIDGVMHHGVVIECEWDKTYKPPKYEITFKVDDED